MSERVPETRSGSSKRSTREARRELLPAMPAITPENSEEEEMDREHTEIQEGDSQREKA